MRSFVCIFTVLLISPLSGFANSWKSDEDVLKPSSKGSLCETNPEKALEILDDLEDRLLCQSLSSADCLKIMGTVGAAGIGAKIAAKKSLGFGRVKLDPDKDILCTASPVAKILFRTKPERLAFYFNQISPTAYASNIYCTLHPGAAYRSELEKLAKSMREEVEEERKKLFEELIQGVGTEQARVLAAGQTAQVKLNSVIEEYLARFKEQAETNPENPHAARVLEQVKKQIRDALAESPPNYKIARSSMKGAAEYMSKNGLPNFTAILPDPEEVRSAIEAVTAERALPESVRNYKGPSSDQKKAIEEIKRIFDTFSENEALVKSELERFKVKFPGTDVNAMYAKYDALRRKNRSAMTASHHLFKYERDLREVTLKAGINRKMLDEGSQAAIKKSIETISKFQSFSNFTGSKIKTGVDGLLSWAGKTKMRITEFSSLSRVARGLSMTAIVVGGKSALASTGVGAIPVLAETAVEEAITRSVTYTTEECLKGAASNEYKLRDNKVGLIGFDYIDLSSTNCKPTGELGPKFSKIFELSRLDRLRILQQNDRLCAATFDIHKSENRFADFDAVCTGRDGEFKLIDQKAEKANFNLIQKRAAEARTAGLTGNEYESYVRSGLSSFDQTISNGPGGMTIKYTSPTSNMRSCASVTLADPKLDSNSRCNAYTQPVKNSTYDYALLSAQCAGQSDVFSKLYPRKITGYEGLSSSGQSQPTPTKTGR